MPLAGHRTASSWGASGPLRGHRCAVAPGKVVARLLLALKWVARAFFAPFGPACGRPWPLCAARRRSRPRRARARSARGYGPPALARRSFFGPRRMPAAPPRLRSLLLPRPAKTSGGPVQSRAPLRFGLRRLLAAAGSPLALGGVSAPRFAPPGGAGSRLRRSLGPFRPRQVKVKVKVKGKGAGPFSGLVEPLNALYTIETPKFGNLCFLLSQALTSQIIRDKIVSRL